jgi:hypothetical protein
MTKVGKAVGVVDWCSQIESGHELFAIDDCRFDCRLRVWKVSLSIKAVRIEALFF